MLKSMKYYGIAWVIVLIFFQVISFLFPVWPNKYTGSFWIGYILIMISFLGFMLFGFMIFNEKDPSGKLYKIGVAGPRCFFGMIICGIAGCVFMAIPFLPAWIGGIICIAACAYCLFYMLLSGAAGKGAEAVRTNVETGRKNMTALTGDANALWLSADKEYKPICKEVYEAVRYSDPMSSTAVSGLESQISTLFRQFSDCVKKHDPEAEKTGKELLTLIKERNIRCKAAK